ncbi:F-box domain-containing protein [Artemisia annua]|uniref:F-box domain-containing protein n=1 Tax=Artemisia annua TaxID=35608 RepID=A0A2U1NSF7_ARTAN|nr:F-box domain-containing protein [Artemisia annua]
MADVHISDHILYNILARLPQKSLLRFQCVSKQWNHLIKDPYLMKLRSNIRRMILFSHGRRLLTTDDTTNSVVEVSSFFGPVDILGTFNGIVLLLVNNTFIDQYYVHHRLILYNPVTRVSKILPDSPSPAVLDNWSHYTFGFGYDTTTDDLKIVRFRSEYYYIHDKCDVFSFKKNSWENILHTNIQEIQFRLRSMGKYLNGFLYWTGYSKLDDKLAIVALNVKDMVLTKINLPNQFSNDYTPLGTIDGCLHMIDERVDHMGFNVWVMKEQGVENSWMIRWSFPLSVEGNYSTVLVPICILDSGKILFMNCFRQLIIIYCTTNASHKKLNLPEELDVLNSCWKRDGIECVESLVSPSDL